MNFIDAQILQRNGEVMNIEHLHYTYFINRRFINIFFRKLYIRDIGQFLKKVGHY